MKRSTRLAAVLILALVLSGCVDVAQQLKAERIALNAALDTQHALRQAGVISAARVAEMLPYEKAAAAALDAGQRDAAQGDSSAAKVYLQAAKAATAKLVTLLPATRPTH